MKAILQSASASNVPGHGLRALTRSAKDSRGRRWPVGTTYMPMSIGTTSDRGDYQNVTIQGETVRFYAKAAREG